MFLFRLCDFNLPKISLQPIPGSRLRSYAARFNHRPAGLSQRNTFRALHSLRRVVLLSSFTVLALFARPAQAQRSNGLTFYHLADSTTKDASGNLLTNLKLGQQTDGTSVAFLNGTGTTFCDATAQLYSVPITGGAVSTLMGPALKVEPTEPAGTSTVLCSHLVLGLTGSTLFYPAYYIPTGGAVRSGIFTLPLAGGASADVLATGDTNAIVPGIPPNNKGIISNVSTTTFSADPSGKLIANYQALYAVNGTTQLFGFNSYPVYGAPDGTGGSTCPGVTLSIFDGQSVSTDGKVFANFTNGTGVNALGHTVAMQFIQIGPWPYAAGCGSVVFAPDLGSLDGTTSTYILPGEPVRNTATAISTMTMGSLAVSNSIVYVSAAQTLSATQGSYSGIFTVAYDLSNTNLTTGTFPLINGLWPPSRTPMPTKIISNYDAVPGITLGLPTCPGGVSQLPAIGSSFTVAGNLLVFTESQTLQNCATMATSVAGGTYAYDLTAKTVQVVAAYNTTLVPGDPIPTNLSAPAAGSLSVDGHYTLVVRNTNTSTSTTTQTLYSTYLYQVVTAVSLTASSTSTFGSSVTLTAKVSPNTDAANGVPATGKVQFLDGTTVLGSQSIDSTGTATLTLTSLATGAHTLQALYTGDTLYEGAGSATPTLTVSKATQTLTLHSSSTSAGVGQAITLTAQSSGTTGYPTGQIVFAVGTTALGTSAIGLTGSATFTLSTLPAGTTQIIATYAGDANFTAATSNTLAIAVGTSDYSVIASPTTATITAGQSATFVFSVTPAFGFNSPVTFSCGTLPSEASCNFAPAIVTPGSGPLTSTLTITTTAPTVARNALPNGPPAFNRTGRGVAGICFAVLLAYLPKRLRQRQKWMVFAIAGVLSVGGLSGCGAIKDLINQNTNPGTAKGTSTVTVSANAGSGSGAVNHTASLTVVIQ
jgi:hypothetical protein